MNNIIIENILTTESFPIWIKRQYDRYEKTGVKPNIIVLLEGIINNINDNISYYEENFYNQSFISTADAENLNKFGDQLNLSRKVGETDEQFRDRLILYKKIRKKGATIEAIKEYINSLGFEIEISFDLYSLKDNGNSEYSKIWDLSDTHEGNTVDGLTVLPENWLNYTYYIKLKKENLLQTIAIEDIWTTDGSDQGDTVNGFWITYEGQYFDEIPNEDDINELIILINKVNKIYNKVIIV